MSMNKLLHTYLGILNPIGLHADEKGLIYRETPSGDNEYVIINKQKISMPIKKALKNDYKHIVFHPFSEDITKPLMSPVLTMLKGQYELYLNQIVYKIITESIKFTSSNKTPPKTKAVFVHIPAFTQADLSKVNRLLKDSIILVNFNTVGTGAQFTLSTIIDDLQSVHAGDTKTVNDIKLTKTLAGKLWSLLKLLALDELVVEDHKYTRLPKIRSLIDLVGAVNKELKPYTKALGLPSGLIEPIDSTDVKMLMAVLPPMTANIGAVNKKAGKPKFAKPKKDFNISKENTPEVMPWDDDPNNVIDRVPVKPATGRTPVRSDNRVPVKPGLRRPPVRSRQEAPPSRVVSSNIGGFKRPGYLSK